MRCFGLTRSSNYRKRCSQEVHWWKPYCWQHWRQPFALVGLITIAASIAELSGYNLRELGWMSQPKKLVLESIGKSSLQGKNEGYVAFALPFIDHPSSVNLPLIVRNPSPERISNLAVTLVINSEYVHVLPETLSSRVDVMGPISKSDRTRTTSHVGIMSSATTIIRGLNGQKAILVGEPLVWTQAYLKQLAAGKAPTVDLDVRISADGVAQSLFKMRLQAVREMPAGANGFAWIFRTTRPVTSLHFGPLFR